jgi:long-chain fatty acid transport protein
VEENKMKKSNLIRIAVLAGLGVLPLSAFATNGMNPEGTGVKNRGMGGAGIAMAEETAAIVINPAAVVNVGDRLDVALGVFSPKPRSYDLSGNTNAGGVPGATLNANQESDSNYFLIPFFGMSFPIDAQSAWAVTISANGGMNTDYANNFAAGLGYTGSTGINLAQLFVSGTYGRKLSPDVSVGISAIYAYQQFEAKGLRAFGDFGLSSDDTALTDNGTDNADGFGVKIGIQAKLSNSITIGAAYQPKVTMSKFDKYKGLFADQGELDIASTISAGIAWKVNPQMTVAFDYLYIDYGDVTAIGNTSTTIGAKLLGSSDGPGFGWESINVFKLGMQYASSDKMTWRVGWNHGDNPIKSSEVSVNFLAPGVITDHLTFGGTYNMDKNSELSFNFVHSFNQSVSGPFAPTLPPFGGGTMKLEMAQNYIEVGYGKKF